MGCIRALCGVFMFFEKGSWLRVWGIGFRLKLNNPERIVFSGHYSGCDKEEPII